MSMHEMSPAQPGLADSGKEARAGGGPLEALLEVSMPVVIEIGRTQMTIEDLLKLQVGSVVQLDRLVGEPVDVYVSDRRLAQGEVVVVGEHFGIRIIRMLSTSNPEVTA